MESGADDPERMSEHSVDAVELYGQGELCRVCSSSGSRDVLNYRRDTYPRTKGGGCTQLSLALVGRLLTTHPLRDGGERIIES